MHGICRFHFATTHPDTGHVVVWCAKGPHRVLCEHPEKCQWMTPVRAACMTIPSAPAEVVLD
jgi:hypothetical protein